MSNKPYSDTSILTYKPKDKCFEIPKIATFIQYYGTTSRDSLLSKLIIRSSHVVVVDLIDIRFTTFKKCKRLVTLKIRYSIVYCFNRPYYQRNILRRVTNLPSSILNLEATGSLVYRIPIGFFKLLAISSTRVKTQQKTKESIIKLDQCHVFTRGGNDRNIIKKRIFFIPKSINELVIFTYVTVSLIRLAIKDDFIYNNIYKRLTDILAKKQLSIY